MSTRAVYSFKEGNRAFHVYKHHDGYPKGAAAWITAAVPYAWPLPRYEADDFAAAFVAANKDPGGGGVYLTDGPAHHGDLSYRYEIRFDGTELHVKAHERAWPREDDDRLIFDGTLAEFQAWANRAAA